MQRVPKRDTLSLLLSVLTDKTSKSSIASVVNATTINYACELLSGEDDVGIAEQLSQTSDAENMLDFMLYLLHDPRLSKRAAIVNIKRRARRFLFKVISRIPVIPASLIVTEVRVPAEWEYIGGGGFGSVIKGELRGAAVALKVLYKSDNNVAFCREALMWRSLEHKFVLPFLGIHEYKDGRVFLVSPYMENGTLARWRKQAHPSIVEIEKRMLEVAQGIEYIHSEGAVHGDLRGENILLDANFHVKIADFGLTRLSEATNTQSGAFHLNFAAPELFGFSSDGNSPPDDVPARTQMSDVYAFGALYYEIHYDRLPFDGRRDVQIMALVSRGAVPPRLDEPPLGDEAWDMIQRCWTREVSERPNIKDITKNMKEVRVRKEEKEKERLRKEGEEKERLRRGEEKKRQREGGRQRKPALPDPGRLNANSSASVPSASAPPKKITLKNDNGTKPSIETSKTSPAPSASTAAGTSSPVTPGKIRIETPEQQQKRMKEEEQKEKPRAKTEGNAGKEKEAEAKRKGEKDRGKGKKKEGTGGRADTEKGGRKGTVAPGRGGIIEKGEGEGTIETRGDRTVAQGGKGTAKNGRAGTSKTQGGKGEKEGEREADSKGRRESKKGEASQEKK